MYGEHRPDAVVGFGGYPAFPSLLAASALRIPTVLHEQNAVLGRVNRLLAAEAEAIGTAYDQVDRLKPKYGAKTVLVGNPVRIEIAKLGELPFPPFDEFAPLKILITGGSQGATVLGQIVPEGLGMDRRLVDEVVTDELRRAAETTGTSKAPQPLVNVSAIRDRLLQFGWVSDARVSRRLPDTLVIDIVERTPAALWQNQGQLALIDGEGVVLDRVPISKMPDLPLLIGPGANAHSQELDQLMAGVPTLKPQLASATWVGRRRWDLNFQSGETIALPEGNQAAGAALQKFAKMDRSTGLLGRGILRFDLRIPGKMIARLPRAPGEPISGEDAANKG